MDREHRRGNGFWVSWMIVNILILFVAMLFLLLYGHNPAHLHPTRTTEIGITLLAMVLNSFWLGVMVLQYEREEGLNASRGRAAWIVLMVVLTLSVMVIGVIGGRYLPLSFSVFIVAMVVVAVMIIKRPVRLAKAYSMNRRLALISGATALVLLASAAALGYINEHQVEERYTINYWRGGCPDNLRKIDGATMQYSAAHNGAYPESIEDLAPDYLKSYPWREIWSHLLP